MKQPSWLASIGNFEDIEREPNFSLEQMEHLSAAMAATSLYYTPPQRRNRAPMGGAAFNSSFSPDSPTSRSQMSSPTSSCGIQEKTILCKFHAKGACTRGDFCTFAHGVGDIKAARKSGHSSGTASPNPLKKTKLCRNLFVDGICPYGTNCDFAHGVNDLRCTSGAGEQPDLNQLLQLPELRPVSLENFKTKICKHYFKTGKCWLEGECHFAHGPNELKRTR